MTDRTAERPAALDVAGAASRPTGGTAGAGDMEGWTPIRVWREAPTPSVDWCYTAGISFTDPFFDDTVQRCFGHPGRLLFRRESSMDRLVSLARATPGLAPSGFILHLSRCGSTLITQMLGALRSTLVASEPGPLASVLDAQAFNPQLPEDLQVAWLRAMVSILGRPTTPEHRHFVVKLDAWATLHLPLLLQAFPSTPWVFVYRDPVEIVMSHLSHRGYHMVPGTLAPELLGLSRADLDATGGPEYPHLVLARLCEAVLRVPTPNNALLVNYAQLPGAVIDAIAPQFGIPVSPEESTQLRTIAGRNAKNPYTDFVADNSDKQRRASPEVRALSAQWVRPYYDALERARGAGR